MSHTILALLLCLSAASLHADWKPAPDSMLTAWGEKLTPANAWQEYPRPAFVRDNWTNLNGLWNYAITPKSATTPPADWAGEILVPFAIESALSGVKKRITPEDALWYRRSFSVSPNPNHRTLLNFEAVDYQSTVWINDQQVGTHTGGNLPFSFDITEALQPGNNTLTLRVTDATDTAYQLHGKQTLSPQGIWYTPVSGIWQTVWLEEVPTVHIARLKITATMDGTVQVDLTSGPTVNNPDATVIASLNGKTVARGSGNSRLITLKIPNPQLWSPESPILYDLTVTFGEDTFTSYVGLRETTVAKDQHGHLRLHLNGKPYFHWGTLDQGWWPDGLLTPPSDAAMASDIEFLKAAGFNTIRKHIKVEPRRYYTHCDRLGMLVWQDQVSSGQGINRGIKISSPKWTRLEPDPTDATWPDAAHQQYMTELEIMMDTLHNHPSIVQWVPFNEAWGQHRTVEVGKWAAAHDPSRQINIASGGNFFPVGHVVDHHQYPHPDFPFHFGEGGRFDGFVKIVGEFGGHGFPVEGHLWDPKARNWGYGGLPKDKEEWIERYKTSLRKLAELKAQGIAGGIYTQTTDVEGEINGLITYDRKVRKLDPAILKTLSDELLTAPDHIEIHTLLPTAENAAQEWRFTTTKPAANWNKPDFDQNAWQKAPGGFGLPSTPKSHVRTKWLTPDIWIRRSFDAPKAPTGRPFLRIYHDEDATVFLNGIKVAALQKFSGTYIELPLPADSLKPGSNTLAIHCKQTTGGQYIDAGIILKQAATNNQ